MTSKLPLKHFQSVGALIEQLRAMKMAPSAGIAADVLEVLILRPSAEEGYRDALADRLVADALKEHLPSTPVQATVIVKDRFGTVLEHLSSAPEGWELRRVMAPGWLPNIEEEGERIVRETYRPSPEGGYLWSDVVGAVQTGIAEERARHLPQKNNG